MFPGGLRLDVHSEICSPVDHTGYVICWVILHGIDAVGANRIECGYRHAVYILAHWYHPKRVVHTRYHRSQCP